MRLKEGILRPRDEAITENDADVEIKCPFPYSFREVLSTLHYLDYHISVIGGRGRKKIRFISLPLREVGIRVSRFIS
jgi:hypothetical protein